MSPPSSASSSVTAPMRQSCDRCHKQKLRCARHEGNNAGACDRCRVKRVRCVYSSSLPKGRPSKYGTIGESTGSAWIGLLNRSTITPALPGQNGADPVDIDTGAVRDANTYEAADAGSNTNPRTITRMNVHGNEASPTSEAISTPQIETPTDAWTWTESLMADDIPMDWGGQNSGQPEWNAYSNDQHDVSLSITNMAPNMLGSILTGKDGGGDDTPVGLPSFSLAQTITSLHAFGEMHSHQNAIAKGRITNKDTSIGSQAALTLRRYNPSVIIWQLTQLSSRLTALRDAFDVCLVLLGDSETQHIRLIDGAKFDSVAVWLAHSARGSASNNLQHAHDSNVGQKMPDEVLSASHHLLEILHELNSKAAEVEPVSASTSPKSTVESSETNPHAPPFGQSAGAADHAFSPSERLNDNIIHHLVIACHTMILNIYAVVLAILHHDAHQPHPTDTVALGQIQLMSLVQLCSYLIDRHHRAVEIFLSIDRRSSQGRVSTEFTQSGSHRLVPSGLTMEDEAMLKDLRKALDQRITGLREVLLC